MKLADYQIQTVSEHITEKVNRFTTHFPLDDVAAQACCLRATMLDTTQIEFFAFLDQLYSLPNMLKAVSALKHLHDFTHNSPTFLPPQEVGAVARFLGSAQEYQDTQIDHAKEIAETIIEKKACELRDSIQPREYRPKYQAWTKQLKTLQANPYWRLRYNDLSKEHYPSFELQIKHALLQRFRQRFSACLKHDHLIFNDLVMLPTHKLFALLKNPSLVDQQGVTKKELQGIDGSCLLNPNQQEILREYCLQPQLETILESEFVDDGTRYLYLSRAFTEDAASYYAFLDQLYIPNNPQSQEILLAFKYIHDLLHNNKILINSRFKPAIVAAGVHQHGSFSGESLENLLACTLLVAESVEKTIEKLQQNKDLQQEIDARLAIESHTPQQACWRAFYLTLNTPGKVKPNLEAPKCLPNYEKCLEEFGTIERVRYFYSICGPLAKVVLMNHPKNAYDIFTAIQMHLPLTERPIIPDTLLADCITHLSTLRTHYHLNTPGLLLSFLRLENNPTRVTLLTENLSLINAFTDTLGDAKDTMNRRIAHLPADTFHLLMTRLNECQLENRFDFTPLTQTIPFSQTKPHDIPKFGRWLFRTLFGSDAVNALKQTPHDNLNDDKSAIWFCALCKHIPLDQLLELSVDKHRLFRTHAKTLIDLINQYNCKANSFLTTSTETLTCILETGNTDAFIQLIENGATDSSLLKKEHSELKKILTYSSAMIQLSKIVCPRNSRGPLSLDDQIELTDKKRMLLTSFTAAGLLKQLTDKLVPLEAILTLSEQHLSGLLNYLAITPDTALSIGKIATCIRTNSANLTDIADIAHEMASEDYEIFTLLLLQYKQHIPRFKTMFERQHAEGYPSQLIRTCLSTLNKQFFSNLFQHPIMEKDSEFRNIMTLIFIHSAIPDRLRGEIEYNQAYLSFFIQVIQTGYSRNDLFSLAKDGDITHAYLAYSGNYLSFAGALDFLRLSFSIRSIFPERKQASKHTVSVLSRLLLALTQYLESSNKNSQNKASIQDVFKLLCKRSYSLQSLINRLTDIFKFTAPLNDRFNPSSIKLSHHALWVHPRNIPSTQKLLADADLPWLTLFEFRSPSSIQIALDEIDLLLTFINREMSPQERRARILLVDKLAAICPKLTHDMLEDAFKVFSTVNDDISLLAEGGFSDLSRYATAYAAPRTAKRLNTPEIRLLYLFNKKRTTLLDFSGRAQLSHSDMGPLKLLSKHIPLERLYYFPNTVIRALIYSVEHSPEQVHRLPLVRLHKRKKYISWLDWVPKEVLPYFIRYKDRLTTESTWLQIKDLPDSRKALITQHATTLKTLLETEVPYSIKTLINMPAFLLNALLTNNNSKRLGVLIENADAVAHLLKHKLTTQKQLLKKIQLDKLPDLLTPLQAMIHTQSLGLQTYTHTLKKLAAQYHLSPKKTYRALRKKRVKQWTLTASLTAILGSGSSVPAIVLPLAFATAALSSPMSIGILSTAAVVFALTALVTTLSSIEAHRCSKETYKKTFWPDQEKRYLRLTALDSSA